MMRASLLILVSLFVAMMLLIMPLPDWVVWYRPQWVLLVLVFWALTLPSRVGLLAAFIAGLFVDLLTASLFGLHALFYVIIIYLVAKLQSRFYTAPVLQQTFLVFLLMMIYQLLQFWVEGMLGHVPSSWHYWLMPVVSMLFWPWIYILLRDFARRYQITNLE